MATLIFAAPGSLQLPPNRSEGADPFKLNAQINEFGGDVKNCPPIQVTQGHADALMINDGVTRASRCHLLAPQREVLVEVIDVRPDWDFSHLPTIEEVMD